MTPSPEATGEAGGALGLSPLVTVVSGTLIALGVLALFGLFAFLAARRRRRSERGGDLSAEGVPVMPAAAARRAAGPRTATTWERDWALDEAPIGSVEYQPPIPLEPERDEDRT